MAKDNKSLGKFQLTGIPPAPRGVPQIEVAFEIDANGILQVAARDKGTGREQSISIRNTGGLSEAELERMRQEAEVYKEEDLRRKQLVQLQNQADSLLSNYESTMRDNVEFIPADLKTQANEGIAELKAAIADKDIDRVQAGISGLEQILLSIGTAVYQQAAGNEQDYAAADYSAETEDMTAADMNGYGDPTLTVEEEDDYGFEDDETITADYEAVD